MNRHYLQTQESFGPLTRWAARLALFALVFQLAALGHWGGGRLTPSELAQHAQHCHGESAACGGGFSSAVADHVPVASLPHAPLARITPTDLTVTVLTDAFVPGLEEPPQT